MKIKENNIKFDFSKSYKLKRRGLALFMAFSFGALEFCSYFGIGNHFNIMDSRTSTVVEEESNGEMNQNERIDESNDVEDDEKVLEDSALSEEEIKYYSEFQEEGKILEEEYKNEIKVNNKEIFEKDKGTYAENSVLLVDVSRQEVEDFADKLGANYRMTEVGGYAVLYLPNNTTINEIYQNDEYSNYAEKIIPDYYVDSNFVDDRSFEIVEDNDDSQDNLEGAFEEKNIDVLESTRLKVTQNRPIYSINDPYYEYQNYLDYIDLQDTWKYSTGKGVKVAIIDSGIDIDHPEFYGKISNKSYNVSMDKGVKSYGMSIIDDKIGHGTAVAGVIAAGMNNNQGITGIAPDVELIVIKCEMDTYFDIKLSDAVLGIAYAIENDADIINMSFSTSSPLVAEVFNKYTSLAYDNDIICVASAGNDGSSLPNYPASLDNVIGVGAYDTDNNTITTYSNFGINIDFVAPGSAITTTIEGKYKYYKGTSISCPIISAAAALYIAKNGKVELNKMLDLFRASSIDIGELGADNRHGYGEVDIYALVCEKKGTITYNMNTDELKKEKQLFVCGRTVQVMPEPEREYVAFDGWYFDLNCENKCDLYTYIFQENITLYAGWGNEDDGVTFSYITKADGTIEIVSYTGKRKIIKIPDVIDSKKVTSIGEYAFKYNTRMVSVILPKYLQKISEGAFLGCTSLREIEIPDTLTTIEKLAFSQCISLKNVIISDKSELKSIYNHAFSYCALESFYIPSKLLSLGNYVFFGDINILKFKVSEDNRYFKLINEAIYDKQGKRLLYFPSGKTGSYQIDKNTLSIGTAAFAFSRLDSVTLNNNLETIGKEAFEQSHIKGVSFKSSLKTLGELSFAFCERLTSVSFAANGILEEIGDFSFTYCTSLKQIMIPRYVRSIGEAAFSESGLKVLIFENNSLLKYINNSAFSITQLESVCLPKSLLALGTGAFCFNYYLKTVTFEKGSKCSTIGDYTFRNCMNLEEFIIPDEVISIGKSAFFLSGLRKIVIGQKLEKIGVGTFSSCHYLMDISVSQENKKYSSIEGVLFNKKKTEIIIYPAGKEGKYVIPASVTKIGDKSFCGANKLTEVDCNNMLKEIGKHSFNNCTALEKIIFNNGLTKIDEYAFYCAGIKTLDFPDSLTQLEEGAFAFCKNIKSITLPNSLVFIGNAVFMSCTGLNTPIIIPKYVKSIGRFAFKGDYGIPSIIFEKGIKISRLGYATFAQCGIKEITIPESVEGIGQELFNGCRNLECVTFENNSKLKAIPAWTFKNTKKLKKVVFNNGNELVHIQARAFENTISLESINLENCKKLSIINNYAFQRCNCLKNIKLPDSLAKIGRYAFYMCSSLTELYIPAKVEMIGSYAFAGTNKIKLYFMGRELPSKLSDDWDAGVFSYYVGVENVIENSEWIYAISSDKKASIIKYKGNSTNLQIEAINGYKVVSIGNEAFLNNKSIISITLPASLKAIYKAAFKGTASLKSITIPNNVQIIDTEAFSGSGISKVNFSTKSQLADIGKGAFENTNNLTEFIVPENIKEIKERTFFNSGIKSVSLTKNITQIGEMAFSGSKIEKIAIPCGVTNISYKAFRDCKNLKTINFASSNTKLVIRDEAFYNSGITKINIPSYVSYIGNLAFSECNSLEAIFVSDENIKYTSFDGVLYNKSKSKLITCPAGKTGKCTLSNKVTKLAFGAFEGAAISEVVIPQNSKIRSIGYRAFYDCNNLKSIKIPDSVIGIDYYAFGNCKNLETVYINTTSQLSGIYCGAFYNCKSLKNIYISENVMEISDYAFYGTSELSNIQFADNSKLMVVGNRAFEYSGINSFIMPQNLVTIGDYAFHESKIDNFVFNKKISVLGQGALLNTHITRVEKLIIPQSLENIGKEALKGFENIKEIIVPNLGKILDYDQRYEITLVDIFGINIRKSNLEKIKILGGDYISQNALSGIESLKYIYLPSSLKIIGPNAFKRLKIKSIELPKGVIEIENNAFSESDIESISMPDSVKRIGYEAFSECEYLKEARTGANTETIASKAFYRCYNLQKVSIGKNVKKIGLGAFTECVRLKNLTIHENNRNFKCFDGILYNYDYTDIIFAIKHEGVINIHEGLTEIKDGIFDEYEEIEKVIIPDTVVKIGKNAFADCTNLKSVELSSNLTEISDGAFSNCSKLNSIHFPDSLKTIGEESFCGCDALTELTIPSNVIKIGEGAFRTCLRLQKVNLCYSYFSIPKWMFASCEKLTTVNIKGKIRKIDENAFYDCISLGYIYIPKSINQIESSAFSKNMKVVEIDPNNENFTTFNGMIFTKNYKNLIFIPYGIGNTIVFPEGIEKITSINNTEIEKIVLPNSVREISEYAFENCSNLKEVILNEGLEKIGDCAFYGIKIQSLKIPDTVKSIGAGCFRDCKLLGEISGGNNIEHIGIEAFNNTLYSKKTENYYDGLLYYNNCVIGCKASVKNKSSLSFKEGTRLISAYTFYEYSNLKMVYLPDSMEYIGNSAFRYCNSLAYVRFGNNIKKIEGGAFENCNLYSVNLKSLNKTDLEPYSFYENYELTYIKCVNTTENDCGLESERVITYVGAKSGIFSYIKNLVLNDKNEMNNTKVAANNSETVIFFRLTKDEVDNNYARNNKKYFNGEWNLATFYVDDIIVKMNPLLNAQVVQAPAMSIVKKLLPKGATFVGWDINGDGKADKLPVTLTSDLEAVAVYNINIENILMDDTAEITVGKHDKLNVRFNPVVYGNSISLIWKSSNNKIVKVDNTGTITGVSEGVATITVKLSSDTSICTQCKVTVKPKTYGIKLKDETVDINVGKKYQIMSSINVPDNYNGTYKYLSNNTAIATVSDSGIIKAVSTGTTEIVVSYGKDYSAILKVNVKQPLKGITLIKNNGSVAVGNTIKIEVKYNPINTTDDKTICWVSMNEKIASVDSNGVVTGIKAGKTRIMGMYGSIILKFEVEVIIPLEKIEIDNTSSTLHLDQSRKLTITYYPENTTENKTIKWVSNNPEVVSVDQKGIISGLANGKAIITAIVGTHKAKYVVNVIGYKDEKTGIVFSNKDDTNISSDINIIVDTLNIKTINKKYGTLYYDIDHIINRNGRIYNKIVYDFSLYINDEYVHPDKQMYVEMPKQEMIVTEPVFVYRIENDGSYTDMKAEVKNGKIRFVTKRSGVYCLAVPTSDFEVTSISFKNKNITTNVGKEKALITTILPENAIDKTISFTSSDESVVKIIDNKLYAIGEGIAEVTATSNAVPEVSARCKVIVKERLQTIDIPRVNDNLIFNGKTQIGISKGEGYIISNNSAVNAGEYVAKISLTDKEKTEWSDGTQGDKEIKWRILPANIDNKVKVELGVIRYRYDGSLKMPTVSVLYGEKKLVKGRDFTIEFANNQNAGKAKAIFKGYGNYSFSKELEYEIIPNVIKQPTNIKKHYGEMAIFTIEAEGGKLSYQWQVSVDGVTWRNCNSDGNTTTKLNVKASSTLNGRKFRCKISCGGVITYSKVITLVTIP